MKTFVAKFQIGKQGLTEGVLESLKMALKNHKQVRISILKSTGRDKNKMEEIVTELKGKIPGKNNYRILGFTIIIIKS